MFFYKIHIHKYPCGPLTKTQAKSHHGYQGTSPDAVPDLALPSLAVSEQGCKHGWNMNWPKCTNDFFCSMLSCLPQTSANLVNWYGTSGNQRLAAFAASLEERRTLCMTFLLAVLPCLADDFESSSFSGRFLCSQHSQSCLQKAWVKLAEDARSLPPCQPQVPFWRCTGLWYTSASWQDSQQKLKASAPAFCSKYGAGDKNNSYIQCYNQKNSEYDSEALLAVPASTASFQNVSWLRGDQLSSSV